MPRQDLLESRFERLLPLTTYTVNQSAEFTLLVLSVGLIIPCMPACFNQPGGVILSSYSSNISHEAQSSEGTSRGYHSLRLSQAHVQSL